MNIGYMPPPNAVLAAANMDNVVAFRARPRWTGRLETGPYGAQIIDLAAFRHRRSSAVSPRAIVNSWFR